MVNTRLLKAKIVENGYTQTTLAGKLNVTPATLGAKIRNKGDFKVSEVIALCDLLSIDDGTPYFFAVW